MDNNIKEFEILDRELMYKGKIIDFYKDTLKTPTGDTVIWDYIDHKGAAAVVPVDEEGNIILVSQYRNAIRKQTLEIPAGGINPGEEPMVSAMREVEEETGYNITEIHPLTNIYTAIAYCNEIIYMYYAKVGSMKEQNLDEDEFIDVKKYSLDEIKTMILNGTIQDTKTISAILTYDLIVSKQNN
ncbi:MAG: NUDIX hydrolase [Lachnospiraceae bacterium]|nr:NUDIX hydrolase [Lachnospiraceae bacterium]